MLHFVDVEFIEIECTNQNFQLGLLEEMRHFVVNVSNTLIQMMNYNIQ